MSDELLRWLVQHPHFENGQFVSGQFASGQFVNGHFVSGLFGSVWTSLDQVDLVVTI